MATEPPPFVTFRSAAMSPAPTEKPSENRIPLYALALELSKLVYTVVELTEGVERFYLRDNLDRTSTAIPLLVARGLSTGDMSERRQLLRKARKGVADCVSLFDILLQRGTVEDEVLANARASAEALAVQLDALSVEPPKVY